MSNPLKRRWALVNAGDESRPFGEHGIFDHPAMLLVMCLNNHIARSSKWGLRFEVRMERVR